MSMQNLISKVGVSLKTIALVIAVMVITGYALYAYAGVGENVRGFAWGGTPSADGAYSGLGWISMNNISDASATSYGVNIPLVNGALSGYAWSEYYGWISFNGADLAGCAPALSQATRTGNNITGGARIIAIRDQLALGNAGGYDGCISLSGTAADTTTYGLTVSGSASPLSVNGYAWSSDLGYISFSGTASDGTPYQVQVTYTAPSLASYSASNCSIPAGSNTCNSTVAWVISNPITPSIRQNSVQFSTLASSIGVSRTLSYGNANPANTISFYDNGTPLNSVTPSATCASGSTWNGSVCSANVACNDGADNDGDGDTDFGSDLGCTSATDASEDDPTVAPTLTATPRLVEQGNTGTLTWDTHGANEALCTLTGGSISGNPLLVDTNANPQTGTYSVTVNAMTTYTMTCGSLTDTATFEVVPRGFET